jgi:hypothetical protein
MILQRIAAGLKSRDWFTVVLEVAIVVVGIFIGLQVDDWNQTRKDRAAEQRYLERLAIEVAENRDGALARMESHERRARILRLTFRYLRDGQSELPTKADLSRALCRWHVLPSFRLRTNTYDELVATGNLTLIESEDIRNLLLEAHSQHEVARQQLALFGDTIQEIAAPFRPFLDWSPLLASEQEEDFRSLNIVGGSCNVDLEGLRLVGGVLSIMAELYRSQAIFADYRRLEAEADARVLAKLNELLGRKPGP